MTRALVLLIAICALPADAQTASPQPEVLGEIAEPPGASPSYRMLVPGLLARTVFVARDPESGVAVSVLGLLLGPGQTSEEARLEQDLVLLVRSGRGMITVDDRHDELTLGVSHSVPAGTSFKIENFDDETALSLRGVLVGGER